jgi:hypothetical protein
MSVPEINELVEVLARVKAWDPATRIILARQILETLEQTSPYRGSAPRGRPVRELIGIGAGDGPPPDDEQVERWIAEYRMEKYG